MLPQDSFVQVVSRVEQHVHGDGGVETNVNFVDMADFGVVGSNGPLFTVVPNLLLGALANNGGFTPTILPQNPSPAIDVGSTAAAAAAGLVTTGQRGPGSFRVFNAAVDIGAVEV